MECGCGYTNNLDTVGTWDDCLYCLASIRGNYHTDKSRRELWPGIRLFHTPIKYYKPMHVGNHIKDRD